MTGPLAYVRLTDPAVDDLAQLLRHDPQILRAVFKKLLLLERDPRAGEPLLGALVGWRKLVVGDRHWRIVWRVTADERGTTVLEIAEVWAIGARADREVYDEVASRLASMPDSPVTRALTEVVELLGRQSWHIAPASEPVAEPLPDWLVDRLVRTARIPRRDVEGMDLQTAVDAWTAHTAKPT